MRIRLQLIDDLNEKFGKGKWRLRHAINWKASSIDATRRKLDPNKAWAVSVHTGEGWSMPKRAFPDQESIIGGLK